MKIPLGFNMRPCVIIALELLGLEEADALTTRLRNVLDLIEHHMGRNNVPLSRLVVCGTRAIRIAEINPGGTPLFIQLVNSAWLHVELANHGVFVRGAVTIGEAAASNDVVVGLGVSVAERLRDEVAEMPRMIVDPRLLRAVESNSDLKPPHQPAAMNLEYLRQVLREDFDGQWFVDYLKIMANALDGPHAWSTFLELHRHTVERRLNASTTLDRTSRGYTWLRSYHNRVIDELFEEKRLDEAERSRLRIPATSPLVYAFPPSAIKP